MVQTNCPLSSLPVCKGPNKNKSAQQQALQQHVAAVNDYRATSNQYFNKEVQFKKKSNFLLGTATSRVESDIRQKILDKRAAGLEGKEAAARSYATKAYVNEGGSSRTAGRNKYLELLGQQANIDSKISQLAGRGESIMQEGAQRTIQNELSKQYNIKGQAPQFGQRTPMPPTERDNMFMGMLSIGMGVASIFKGSDRKLKKNINRVDTSKDGHPVYEFSYLGSSKRYRGVMAQDIVKTNPMAVHIKNGLLYVDYSKIDVDMELVS